MNGADGRSEGLVLKDVRKVFFRRTPNEVTALGDVSLHVATGDFITIIGSNGAGKSTLLNAIAGTFPIDAGSISLGDKDITGMKEYARCCFVGRVFQDPRAGTAPSLSIEQNMCMALQRGKPRRLSMGVTKKRREVVRQHLVEVGMGLESRMGTQVAKLSGGQRQAVSLLMATIAEPSILLLDEHTAALDPKVAATIMELTDRIVQDRSLTTLMVTHNMELALRHGNRLIMMHGGRIILDVVRPEKDSLTIGGLVQKFHEASGEVFATDRMLLG